jgi:soluble lytic murein transglycosylase-like protein
MSPRDYPTASSNRRQAAPQGEGCLSGFLLPPLAALIIGLTLGWFALRADVFAAPTSSASSTTLSATGAITAPLTIKHTDGLAGMFTPEVQWWGPQLVRWSAQFGLDPNLAATVMQIESCGDPRALSSAGAMGLFQVMPFHFYPTDNPFDPDTNAARGLDYLRRALDAAGGNPNLALAGYNGGIGGISRGQSTWAAETQRYLYWGSGIYQDAQAGLGQSARLDEWRARAGGMCGRAHARLGLP